MHPKSYKELIPSTASTTESSESLVGDLIRFYYREIRRALSDLKEPDVYVKNLGHFKIKFWDLDHFEEMYRRGAEKIDTSRFTGFARKKDFEDQVESIKRMKLMVEELNQEKKSVKQKRDGQESKGGLEEQESNT